MGPVNVFSFIQLSNFREYYPVFFTAIDDRKKEWQNVLHRNGFPWKIYI